MGYIYTLLKIFPIGRGIWYVNLPPSPSPRCPARKTGRVGAGRGEAPNQRGSRIPSPCYFIPISRSSIWTPPHVRIGPRERRADGGGRGGQSPRQRAILTTVTLGPRFPSIHDSCTSSFSIVQYNRFLAALPVVPGDLDVGAFVIPSVVENVPLFQNPGNGPMDVFHIRPIRNILFITV